MTLSFKLAKAIGWEPWSCPATGTVLVLSHPGDRTNLCGVWLSGRAFSYLDWTVAGPIAQRLGVYPTLSNGLWGLNVTRSHRVTHITPQGAIALATIHLSEPQWKSPQPRA